MSKRDFILIAKTIRDLDLIDNGDYTEMMQRDGIARRFANALADTNPRFNRDKFISACHP